MKHQLCFLALRLLIGISAQANVRDRFYLGAGVGASFGHYHLSVRNTETDFSVHRNADKTDALGNVFLGYGYTFQSCFYLGGELGTDFPRRTASVHRSGVVFTTTIFKDYMSVQDYVTGDILPGYRVRENWLIYARAGASYGQIRFHQPAAFDVPRFHSEKNRFGGRFGAGINYGITKHFGVGIDYCYGLYANLRKELNPFTAFAKVKIHTNYVGFSLIYSI